MLWNAQNGTVELGEDRMDYVRFGTGDKPLVMLPGVGHRPPLEAPDEVAEVIVAAVRRERPDLI